MVQACFDSLHSQKSRQKFQNQCFGLQLATTIEDQATLSRRIAARIKNIYCQAQFQQAIAVAIELRQHYNHMLTDPDRPDPEQFQYAALCFHLQVLQRLEDLDIVVIVLPESFSDPKFFLGQKSFGTQIFLGPKLFWIQKIFWTQHFLDQNFFWT